MRQELKLSRDSVSLGTFVKTDSPQVIEVLGTTGLHFAVVDAEHAPFDRMTIDRMILAGRACDLPIVVRLPDATAPTILTMLDMGAAGLLVPHVDCSDQAREIVARARFRNGQRGISLATRAGGYGTKRRQDAMAAGDAVPILCQIESARAVEEAEKIAAVPGVDALFIGRADLAMSMGLYDPQAPEVEDAVTRILGAASKYSKVCAIHVNDMAEAHRRIAEGMTWIVVASDQGLLRKAAMEIA
jgi:2-keto-3-deoxy-L-rhamnonate aldolase RhmA